MVTDRRNLDLKYDASVIYEKRRNRFEKLIAKQTKTINFLSNLRLIVFIAGVAASIYFIFIAKYYIIAAAVLAATAITFIYLAVIHNEIILNRKYSEALKNINEKSKARREGRWKDFEDTGDDFVNKDHAYSYDLDIFGEKSLYQMICTPSTYLGRQKLKDLLENHPDSADEIYARQEAVTELSDNLTFRQMFMADGMFIKGEINDPQSLFEWAEQKSELFGRNSIKAIIRLMPLLAVLSIILAAFSLISYLIPIAILVVNYLFLKMKNKEMHAAFEMAEKYKRDLDVYKRMLLRMERCKFKSSYLVQIQESMLDSEGKSVAGQLKKLSGIVESMTNRYNFFYFFINIIFLWDFQCMISYEKWKTASGSRIRKWLEAIGEIEALSSIAVLKYDNPEWVMPTITEDGQPLTAKKLGHPLLGNDRVCNDLNIESSSGILLITGSNMSGKSTLLRTAGINLVLAYAGAPVCADEFICRIMDIHTCMRVSDDLEQNISSFYAELLRIKNIISEVKKGKPVFFLLDEIFKGTNSKDRHTGARVLIRKLSKAGIPGMVSTHDLELGDLEKTTNGAVVNYHFSEYYKDNEIFFDYILRPGISTTRNAIYLMKMAGIDMEKEEI